MENQNEMVVSNQEENLITEGATQKYYSLIPETREEAVTVYNAVNNPDNRLGDFINMEIEVKHILIENVELTNEKTGELEIVPRTVFIDVNDKSFVAVSRGIFNSTKRLIQMFGEPSTWKEPVKIEVKQIKKGENSILTLNIIG